MDIALRTTGLLASILVLTACTTGESDTGAGGGDGTGSTTSVTTGSTAGTTTTGTTTTGTTTATTGAGGGTGNPACASPAALVVGTPVSGTTTTGTDGEGSSCAFGDGLIVAYAFTATATDIVVFKLDSATDHGLSVRNPSCDSAVDQISCVDAAGNNGTEVATIAVTSGQTYYLLVEAYNQGDEGTFTLAALPSCTMDASCGTDEYCSSSLGACQPKVAACIAPATLSIGTPISDDTASAGDDTDSACSGGNEVAYAFTAPATASYAVSLSTSTDQGLSIRSPGCNDISDELDCTDTLAAIEWLVLPATSGETYYVVVEAYDAFEEGAYTLEVEAVQPPQTCASPTVIGLGFTVGDNTTATDTIDGSCVVGDGAESVFAFTAPASGMLTIAAAQTGGDIGVSVRTPSCATAGDEIICENDNPFLDEYVDVAVVSGTTYYIVVDADTVGEEGVFSLNLTLQ